MRQLIAYRAQNQSVSETEVQFCDAEEGGQEGTEGCEGRLLERCLRGREERRPRLLAVIKRALDAPVLRRPKSQRRGGEGRCVFGMALRRASATHLESHLSCFSHHNATATVASHWRNGVIARFGVVLERALGLVWKDYG